MSRVNVLRMRRHQHQRYRWQQRDCPTCRRLSDELAEAQPGGGEYFGAAMRRLGHIISTHTGEGEG